MKFNSTLTLITMLCLLAFSDSLMAQTYDPGKSSNDAIFIEFGNLNGITFNYDHRFNKSGVEGFGIRVGAGGIVVGADEYILEGIVCLNFLSGSKGNFFEASAGPVFHNGVTQSFTSDGNKGSYLLGNVYFGYRRQSKSGKFVFRAGTPFNFGLINDVFCLIPFPAGISFGLSF